MPSGATCTHRNCSKCSQSISSSLNKINSLDHRPFLLCKDCIAFEAKRPQSQVCNDKRPSKILGFLAAPREYEQIPKPTVDHPPTLRAEDSTKRSQTFLQTLNFELERPKATTEPYGHVLYEIDMEIKKQQEAIERATAAKAPVKSDHEPTLSWSGDASIIRRDIGIDFFQRSQAWSPDKSTQFLDTWEEDIDHEDAAELFPGRAAKRQRSCNSSIAYTDWTYEGEAVRKKVEETTTVDLSTELNDTSVDYGSRLSSGQPSNMARPSLSHSTAFGSDDLRGLSIRCEDRFSPAAERTSNEDTEWAGRTLEELLRWEMAKAPSSWLGVAQTVRENLRQSMMEDVVDGDANDGVPMAVPLLELLEPRIEALKKICPC